MKKNYGCSTLNTKCDIPTLKNKNAILLINFANFLFINQQFIVKCFRFFGRLVQTSYKWQ